MNFIELTRPPSKAGESTGKKFMYDLDSGWKIFDRGSDPSYWSNEEKDTYMSTAETYAELKAMLIPPKLARYGEHGSSAESERLEADYDPYDPLSPEDQPVYKG